MKNSEAAEIIEAIARSLRNDPSQFHISIRVVGQQVTSYGGTGMSINVTGGGPGSQTIGNKVSMSGPSIQLDQAQATQAFQEQVAALSSQLDLMATELRREQPNKPALKSTLDSLKNTWVPGIIIEVVGNLLSHVLTT